jgi:hypothetical protein
VEKCSARKILRRIQKLLIVQDQTLSLQKRQLHVDLQPEIAQQETPMNLILKIIKILDSNKKTAI